MKNGLARVVDYSIDYAGRDNALQAGVVLTYIHIIYIAVVFFFVVWNLCVYVLYMMI